MDILLTDDEVRVLGCLMEKEMATPDYYPLTQNALINACNQKSNRNPVVSYDEKTVLYALTGLKERRLVLQSNVSRATKYEQLLSGTLKLVNRESAIICVLLLRGAQTPGEIRSRTDRLFSFADLSEVQDTITSLEEMELITKLPKEPGRKESRYSHLFSGMPVETPVKAITRAKAAEPLEESSSLQQQIDELRHQLQQLKEQFTLFRSQFE